MRATQNQSALEPIYKNLNVKFRFTYRLVLSLVEGLPLSAGMKLRRLAYRSVFAKLGNSVQLEPNVNFTRTYLVSIGDKVYIRSGANIEVCGEDSKLRIGDEVRIERGVDIRSHGGGGDIVIGDRTRIGPYTCLSGRSIQIGKDCLIASHSSIYANNHIFSDPARKINEQDRSYQGIVIEDDCWLGSGVRVLDGVIIGRGSVVGAGAVVTKNIPSYSIAVGVPAKVIGQRNGTG